MALFASQSPPRRLYILLLLLLALSFTSAQTCGRTKPCASGCCSKFGICGTGPDHCGDGCIGTCDFKLGCDASNPCASGCCNSFGFCGLGPDYCGDSCVAGCDTKSYCDPGGYGVFAEVSKCPLNVCCSKYGFCGLTEEFCGTKKVKRPSCPTIGGLSRVVGYYEGWSAYRPCHAFLPENIPMGVYTHLNFAFATVDPKTFEILPATTTDKKMYKRLTGLKRNDPDLKVFIAIGGWSFNDPGPTATTFSDIASSEANTNAFIKSLTSFMATYDFDGVDIDWEYPEAEDRSGCKQDFANFPTFIARLKRGLKATGGRDGLSITLPASYWYLQHFDIAKLVKDVDWFNMMTYDLHGTWDKGNKWVGNYLNAHTNLTEITEAMDLLWRNNITPNKVVLGTAFYGRAFTASSPNCLSPGCTFDSGAKKGPCSQEVSILLGSEITDIIESTGNKPVLDKDAAVKILTYNEDQWVAYDDADTLKMKANFARSQCMGGLMVWAVSHDTPDGSFTKALATAANRKIVALQETSDEDTSTTTVTQFPQCKWTNCKEECPSGWTRVLRQDAGARGTEYLTDQSACDGIGSHQFCCPPSQNPTCGWYTHNNGKCDPKCPNGMVEVGSNSMYCNNNKYQAACCTVSPSISATKLYNQCSWADWPLCDNGICSNTEIVSSTTGSGGAECNVRSYSPKTHELAVQERKYCCDATDDNSKWEDCQWYNDIGFGPAGRSWSEDNYCLSGCPPDRVRVGMDKYGGGCVGKGGRSKCCLPKLQTVTKQLDGRDENYASDLLDFLDQPTCDYDAFNEGWWKKRDFGNSSIELRDRLPGTFNLPYHKVESFLYLLLFMSPTQNQLSIWNDYVPPKFPNLQLSKIKAWVNGKISTTFSRDDAVNEVVCEMGYINDRIGKTSTANCFCLTRDCCDANDTECQSDEDPSDDYFTKRDSFSGVPNESGNLGQDGAHWRIPHNTNAAESPLEKRVGKPRPFHFQVATLPAGRNTFVITSLSYYQAGDMRPDDPLWDFVFDVGRDGDCTDVDVVTVVEPLEGRRPGRALNREHIIELNTPARFFAAASAGAITSGTTIRVGPIVAGFYEQALLDPLPVETPPMAGGEQSLDPRTRIMNALGSKANGANLVLTIKSINSVKNKVLMHHAYKDAKDMKDLVEKEDPTAAFMFIRTVIGVIHYMNHPKIQAAIKAINDDIRLELYRVEQVHNNRAGNTQIELVRYWDVWFRRELAQASQEARTWVAAQTLALRNQWMHRTGTVAEANRSIIKSLRSLGSDMDIILDALSQEPLGF